jgi:hypothetical protein
MNVAKDEMISSSLIKQSELVDENRQFRGETSHIKYRRID